MGPRGGAGPAPPLDGDSVDFVLTLGGDGLLMYSNTLFRVRAGSVCLCSWLLVTLFFWVSVGMFVKVQLSLF